MVLSMNGLSAWLVNSSGKKVVKVIPLEYSTNLFFTTEEIEEFFHERREHFSEHYITNAKYTLESLLFHLKQRGVEKITPATISELLQLKYDKETGEFTQKTLKRTSLKNLLNRVVTFYIWKLGDTHPFVSDLRKYIKNIKVPQIPTKHIAESTINYLLENLPPNYSFLIWLGVNTSARRSALCNMNIDDITLCKFQDLERFIHPDVFEQLLEKWADEEAAIIRRLDKYGGEYAKQEIEVPLFPNDIDKLLDYLSERLMAIELSGKKFEDEKGEFLFWNDHYKRMNPESASKYINHFCRKHGITFTIHHTRHYAIQKWYRLGMRKATIRKFSGHKSNIIDRYLDIDTQTAFSELATIQLKRDKNDEEKTA